MFDIKKEILISEKSFLILIMKYLKSTGFYKKQLYRF